jgi:hypothetical protein
LLGFIAGTWQIHFTVSHGTQVSSRFQSTNFDEMTHTLGIVQVRKATDAYGWIAHRQPDEHRHFPRAVIRMNQQLGVYSLDHLAAKGVRDPALLRAQWWV